MATKEALNLMGLPAGKLRLPLTRLKEKNRKVLESVLRGCRLI
jgi:dihydrodipicolinate synthase/N-acetylneuraminate lyase